MKERSIITADEAMGYIQDGDTIMVGGFMGVGSPPGLLRSLRESGRRDMILVCSDNGLYRGNEDEATGVALNVLARQFRRIVSSHIGLNTETQRQMIAGETEVELVPQGTLAERIRAAGAGLGAVLTPTGVGTEVADGKQVIRLGDRDYLLELPIHGDVTLIRAAKADRGGNLTYAASARNFCPLMATAARTVLVEADEIVDIGALTPEEIITPGIFVDYLIQKDEGGAT